MLLKLKVFPNFIQNVSYGLYSLHVNLTISSLFCSNLKTVLCSYSEIFPYFDAIDLIFNLLGRNRPNWSYIKLITLFVGGGILNLCRLNYSDFTVLVFHLCAVDVVPTFCELYPVSHITDL